MHSLKSTRSENDPRFIGLQVAARLQRHLLGKTRAIESLLKYTKKQTGISSHCHGHDCIWEEYVLVRCSRLFLSSCLGCCCLLKEIFELDLAFMLKFELAKTELVRRA